MRLESASEPKIWLLIISSEPSCSTSTLSCHATQLGQKCELDAGPYVGNDDPDTGTGSQTIHLGFTPKAVLVIRDGVYLNGNDRIYGGLALAGYAATSNAGTAVQIVSNGFTVSSASISSSSVRIRANTNGDRYFYLAFK